MQDFFEYFLYSKREFWIFKKCDVMLYYQRANYLLFHVLALLSLVQVVRSVLYCIAYFDFLTKFLAVLTLEKCTKSCGHCYHNKGCESDTLST